MSLDIVRSGLLKDIPHGFFGRKGGVSKGAVAGLNCGFGSGDDPSAIETNRRLAADAILQGAPLASVYQVHSPTAVIVAEAAPYDERPKADALVTDRPGLPPDRGDEVGTGPGSVGSPDMRLDGSDDDQRRSDGGGLVRLNGPHTPPSS